MLAKVLCSNCQYHNERPFRLANFYLFGDLCARHARTGGFAMSNARQNSEKKKIDYFELIVWTLATVIVLMLVAHWIGLY